MVTWRDDTSTGKLDTNTDIHMLTGGTLRVEDREDVWDPTCARKRKKIKATVCKMECERKRQ